MTFINLILVVMALVLSLVSSLFILLSWGACFIPDPWYHVVVVTFVLSLPTTYLFFCHKKLVLSRALDTVLLRWRLFYPWSPTYLSFCHDRLILSLALNTMLLWWRLFYPSLPTYFSCHEMFILYLVLDVGNLFKIS